MTEPGAPDRDDEPVGTAVDPWGRPFTPPGGGPQPTGAPAPSGTASPPGGPFGSPDAVPGPRYEVPDGTGYGLAYGHAPHAQDGPRWGMGDVGIGFLLYLGAQLVAGVLLVVVLLATGRLDETTAADEVTSEVGLLSLLIAAPIAWVALFGYPWWVARRKGSGSIVADFGWGIRWLDVAKGLGGGFAGLVASVVAGLSFEALFGSEAPTNTDIIPSDGISAPLMLAVFFVIAVGTPIAEEMFFRGLAMGALRKRWGTTVAVVVSSVIFGAAHVQPDLQAWAFVGAVTGTYGVVFALLRVWTQGRLAAPIVAHMVVNAVGVIAVFATA